MEGLRGIYRGFEGSWRDCEDLTGVLRDCGGVCKEFTGVLRDCGGIARIF